MTVNPEDSSQFLTEMSRIQRDYVASRVAWYQDKKKWPRRLARGTTIALIVLSSSVPFLTGVDGWRKDVLLPIVALLIAALSGLKAAYQWERTWQAYAVAQFLIEDATGKWNVEMTRARHAVSAKASMDRAYRATLELLHVASTARDEETKAYFEDLRAAAVATSRHPSEETDNRDDEGS